MGENETTSVELSQLKSAPTADKLSLNKFSYNLFKTVDYILRLATFFQSESIYSLGKFKDYFLATIYIYIRVTVANVERGLFSEEKYVYLTHAAVPSLSSVSVAPPPPGRPPTSIFPRWLTNCPKPFLKWAMDAVSSTDCLSGML